MKMYQNKLKRKPKQKTKIKTLIGSHSSEKIRADKYFSLYVRVSNANEQGICFCYTCHKPLFWTKEGHDSKSGFIDSAELGHFIGRRKNGLMGTRYSEANTKIQCYRCNIHLKGNIDIFAMKLKQDYGNDIIEKLQIQHKKTIKTYELKAIADFYEKRYNETRLEKHL
jgi:peptide methionine sulfoxide reductase MsrB